MMQVHAAALPQPPKESWSTGNGPFVFLGKAMTSRIESAPVIIMTNRSNQWPIRHVVDTLNATLTTGAQTAVWLAQIQPPNAQTQQAAA